VDYLTGYEQTFLLFYLVPIGLGTWFGNFWIGLAFSMFSIIAWVVSDVAAGVPTVGLWNIGMAIGSYAVFTSLLSKLRTLLNELDQRVRDRTDALKREMAERERLDQEIAEVADRERRRLGQNLHDSVGQHLTGTALAAQVLRESLLNGPRLRSKTRTRSCSTSRKESILPGISRAVSFLPNLRPMG